jgi:hypothetical protein
VGLICPSVHSYDIFSSNSNESWIRHLHFSELLFSAADQSPHLQDPAKNILLCTRTHQIFTVTKKSTLEKKAVSETPLFPKKTALGKRAVSEAPLSPQWKGQFFSTFFTETKKSTLEKRAVSETPLFPKKTALGKRAVSEMPLFPNHDSMDCLQTVLYIHKSFAGSSTVRTYSTVSRASKRMYCM